MELKEKEAETKRLKDPQSLFRKNLQLKDVCHSTLKATKILGQKKVFYRQRIIESGGARKETVDMDILVTCTNGDRKSMQCIRITNRPPSIIRKWNQLSQFRRTSTKVIPIKKTSAGYISVMSQGFKRGTK